MGSSCLRLCFTVLFCFALAVGGISSVYAQSDSDEFILEEVTVTAQKRAENQQKVAIQMEVITGEDLVGTGKDNVDDILRDVANVMINKNEDGMRITMRGLADEEATFQDTHISTPSVAVNIDGAYNNASNAGQNLFDLERVEVLAGPQSTLYGSNSPGGIVNVVTASPKTDKFSASASGEFGNYGLFDGQLMVNVPIIQDLLGMRLSGHMYQRDTFVSDQDASQDNKTLRLKTMIEPSDTFNATLTLNYSENTSNGKLRGLVSIFDTEDGIWYSNQEPVTNPWTYDVPGPGFGGNARGGGDPSEPNYNEKVAETEGIQADISWDTAFGSISFVPYYNETRSEDFRDDVELYLDVTNPDAVTYTSQFSENFHEQQGADLRITSPEDFPFKWIIGGTYFKSRNKRNLDDYDFDINDSYWLVRQDNKAVYANVTYPITDTFRGTVGYRLSWDDVGSVEVPPKVADGITGHEYNEPDYKVGVEYDLSEDAMLYGYYATSYKVTVMAHEQDGKKIPPEELKSYNVGIKSRFLDNKLQVNASAYYYDYSNKSWNSRGNTAPGMGRFTRGEVIIEPDYPWVDRETGESLPGTDIDGDGNYNDTNLPPGDPRLEPGWTSDLIGLDTIANGDPWWQQYGTFESYGLDVSVDWVPTPKDRLHLSLAYLNSEWSDAVNTYYWAHIWSKEGISYNGRPANYSPEWTISASYDHIFDLGSVGTLIPQVDVQYKSEYELSFEEEYYPWNHQEPYYILNGALAFNHSSGRWSLKAYLKNVTEYAAKNFWNAPHNDYRFGITDPRTYGAVVSIKY